MTQATGGMSFASHYVGFSANGSAWTDVSGYSNSVSVSGGERVTGTAYTADGDTAIIKNGKRQPLTVTVRIVYTETSSQAYDMAKDAYEVAGGGPFYVRWSPGGGDAADLGFTSSLGVVKTALYPQGSATR